MITTLFSLLIFSSFINTEHQTVEPSPNNSFKTIKIGDQIWMAENLDIYATGSRCYLDDYFKRNDCQKYGRYYTWEAAKNAANSIEGWRLPTRADFEKLLSNVGGSSNGYYRLKEDGNTGFKAKFAGHFVPITTSANDYYGSDKGDFEKAGLTGFFWAYNTVPYRSRKACLIISSLNKRAEIGNAYDKTKLSVRLIKE